MQKGKELWAWSWFSSLWPLKRSKVPLVANTYVQVAKTQCVAHNIGSITYFTFLHQLDHLFLCLQPQYFNIDYNKLSRNIVDISILSWWAHDIWVRNWKQSNYQCRKIFYRCDDDCVVFTNWSMTYRRDSSSYGLKNEEIICYCHQIEKQQMFKGSFWEKSKHLNSFIEVLD